MDDILQNGITAYHGSPHDFEQFDISKIGTGEGAQSFGHGLYFAQAEPTAIRYRDQLAGQNVYLIDHIMQHAPELKKLDRYDRMALENASRNKDESPLNAAKSAQDQFSELKQFDTNRIANVIASHRNASKGHMYEVNINAHPHHILDWNNKLSDQPEHIQNAVHASIASAKQDSANGIKGLTGPVMSGREVIKSANPNNYMDHDGAMIQQMLAKVYGAKGASDVLYKNGIKGIKYLDAVSRGANAKPTHNYVIFDDKLVNVKRKYEQGGRVERNTGGPVNVSKAQDTAGNFKKEHEKIHGIPVAIEVKKGHERVKYKPDGKVKFKAKQYADYGAILGTKDADGMNTDVMVGPHKDSDKAYIIDQRKHDSGKFDEHKVLLGFNKRKKAVKAYTKSYADRHGKERVQDVVKTDIKGLKKWLAKGNLNEPAAKSALIKSALEVVSKKT